MNRSILLFLIASYLFTATQAMAQGCSDAGICSMGSLEGTQPLAGSQNRFSVAHLIGMGEHFEKGEQKTILNTLRFGASALLFKNTLLDAKIPITFVNGDLGKTSGLGDLSISLSQLVKEQENYRLLVSAGAKLRTNHADKSNNGRSFPMAYQTSLGTNDLLLGISLYSPKWHISAGKSRVVFEITLLFLMPLAPG